MFADTDAFRVLNTSPLSLSVLLPPGLSIVIPAVLPAPKFFADRGTSDCALHGLFHSPRAQLIPVLPAASCLACDLHIHALHPVLSPSASHRSNGRIEKRLNELRRVAPPFCPDAVEVASAICASFNSGDTKASAG